MKPNSSPLYRKPRTETEKIISEIWIKFLNIPKIGIDDNFFEMGVDSLIIEQVAAQLNQLFNIADSSVKIYQYPTVALLSEQLSSKKNKSTYSTINKRKIHNKDIAIIGMAGRFPGANSINELWDILKDGKETISFFKPEDLDFSIPESLKNNPRYIKARGIIPSAKTFDSLFFNINQRLAEVMDPQIRLFLEIAWEVLEENGYLPEHYKGSIGVYAGTGTNSYYKNNILPNKEILEQVGRSQARTVNEDFIATRTAYHLNLNGPAVTVQSACSTSLLAITEAVEALRNGHCDIAIAGASSVTAPIQSGHLYQEGAIFSPDGHCRSFDAEAKGTVFSDGAGIVLLKSLDSAKKDGDVIHCIIKGIGVNNDGGNKGSFSAPNSEGQAGAIAKALTDANIDPSQISYVEAHGTATPLGDPIEMKGLNLAFGEQNKLGYCALGSIKSNLGHLTAAAGVAGLIKTILAMRHKQIPASLGFNSPNPAIDFENSPFYVNSALNTWEVEGPRIAGISSFGIGGTNVHVIVEEYNSVEKETKPSRPLQLLTWSAKTQPSLSGYETALGDFLQTSNKTNLSDIAYSLSKTRASFNNRSFTIAKNNTEASNNIIGKHKNFKTLSLNIAASDVVFLFTGQGSQFLQMGKSLYDNEKIYRDAVDTCAELLMDILELDIRKIIYPESNTFEAEELLKDTRFTQPALFVTEYALSQLWYSWGIKPTVLCGHSIGEFVAAHLAGVFNLKDALQLIATRGFLISELPRGSMLSVRIPEKQLKEILPKTLSVAAINSKHLCVVAGKDQDVEDFAKIMESKNIPNRILITSHAFHSSMMNPILESFDNEIKQTNRNIPNIPIISSVTGTWLTNEEATSASYWVNHLRNTVRFADALETVLELDNPILLEIGPGKALITLAHQQSDDKIITALPSLTFSKEQENDYATILESLGELWLHGVNPDWKTFYDSQERQIISLPSYVFDRKPCWIEPINCNDEDEINQKQSVQCNSTSINNITEVTPRENRKFALLQKVSGIIKNVSGVNYNSDGYSKHFLELGLDSLTLTQVAILLSKEFNIPISFRQLNEDLNTLEIVADYLDKRLPEENLNEPITNTVNTISNTNEVSTTASNDVDLLSSQQHITLEYLAKQIQLLSKQIADLKNNQNISSNNTFLEPIIKQESLTSKDSINKNASINNMNSEEINESNAIRKQFAITPNEPPVQGARLGRDDKGLPAWYIADSNEKGKYIKIDL